MQKYKNIKMCFKNNINNGNDNISTNSKNSSIESYFAQGTLFRCTFGNGRNSFSTKHEMRWLLICCTSNRASMGDFPSKIWLRKQWQIRHS